MSTAIAVPVFNAEWEERLYCPRCDTERPFLVTCKGDEEEAMCARCGLTDDRTLFGDDIPEDFDYEETSMDGGGWD